MPPTIDSNLITAMDLLLMKRQGVASLGWCEVFKLGQHQDGDRIYTADDMQQVVGNFQQFSEGVEPLLTVPLGIGHENDQRWLKSTGLPAAGLVTRLQFDGETLWAFCDKLPAPIVEMIEGGLYFTVSVEFYDEPPPGLPSGAGTTLRRIALLGGDIPAVKGLGRLPKPQRYRQSRAMAERLGSRAMVRHYAEVRRQGGTFPTAPRYRHVSRRVAEGRYHTFAENVMDRAAMTEQLKGLGFTPAQLTALDGLDDQAYADFVLATLAAAAGSTTGGDTGAPPADTGAAEVPPNDIPTLVADIMAMDPSQDQAALEAMSLEELQALWVQLKGNAGATMSEGVTVPRTTPTPVAAPTPPASGPTVATFAEVRRESAALRRQLAKLSTVAARIDAQTRTQRQMAERQNRAQREATVRAYAEKWTDPRCGLATPGEMDPASKTPNLYHRMMQADATVIRTYGETKVTEFDSIVQEVEAREPRLLNTRGRVPTAPPGSAEPEEVAYVKAQIKAKQERQAAMRQLTAHR